MALEGEWRESESWRVTTTSWSKTLTNTNTDCVASVFWQEETDISYSPTLFILGKKVWQVRSSQCSTYIYHSGGARRLLRPTPCPKHSHHASWRNAAPLGKDQARWLTPTPELWTAQRPEGARIGKREEEQCWIRVEKEKERKVYKNTKKDKRPWGTEPSPTAPEAEGISL